MDWPALFFKMYLDQSITDENADRSYLSGNLAGENVVVSMTKLSFCYTLQDLHFPPISCLKSVSQRDTAVSSQKRPKSVLDTDDPYHVACLVDQLINGSYSRWMTWEKHRRIYFLILMLTNMELNWTIPRMKIHRLPHPAILQHRMGSSHSQRDQWHMCTYHIHYSVGSPLTSKFYNNSQFVDNK